LGDNLYGQSGSGNSKSLNPFYKLNYFENKKLKIKKIVCGGSFDIFNIFLTGIVDNINYFFNFLQNKNKNLECGKLFSVGSGFSGCIGDGKMDHCTSIKQIEYFSRIFIVDIACGARHCLSISNKGDIFSWGDNKLGQLGNDKNVENQLFPIKIFKI
jgi:hypothetical protein